MPLVASVASPCGPIILRVQRLQGKACDEQQRQCVPRDTMTILRIRSCHGLLVDPGQPAHERDGPPAVIASRDHLFLGFERSFGVYC